jgi:hypothetical protein
MSLSDIDKKSVQSVMIAGKWHEVADSSFNLEFSGDWFRFTEALYTQGPQGSGKVPTGTATIAGPANSIMAVRLKS